jgi:hypothetical protein
MAPVPAIPTAPQVPPPQPEQYATVAQPTNGQGTSLFESKNVSPENKNEAKLESFGGTSSTTIAAPVPELPPNSKLIYSDIELSMVLSIIHHILTTCQEEKKAKSLK